jgi:hypothetical protein
LKEHWVLRDKSNRFAQRGQRVAHERLLFEEDATGFRIGGAYKKAAQGALARSARTDDCKPFVGVIEKYDG